MGTNSGNSVGLVRCQETSRIGAEPGAKHERVSQGARRLRQGTACGREGDKGSGPATISAGSEPTAVPASAKSATTQPTGSAAKSAFSATDAAVLIVPLGIRPRLRPPPSTSSPAPATP